jgi:succinyl-diaminopimelate desuccinylase
MTDPIERAFTFIQNQDAYAADVMLKLLGVDTCVPEHGNYAAFCDLLESLYNALGFRCERVVVPPEKAAQIRPRVTGERINLVASQDTGKPPCSIYAHMDTVPIGEGWTHNPYGEAVGDRIYGRGAVDMKGSIGALLLALRTLSELNIEPRCDVVALMCTDEELGVYPGVRYLAEQGYVPGELVWLEAGLQAPLQIYGSAGDIEVSLKASGRSSHSGMNFLGVNAVEAMVPMMEELMALKERIEQQVSAIPLLPLSGAEGRKMSSMFNLNVVRGGVKANMLPAECSLTLDCRYIPEVTFEEIAADLQAAIQRGRARSKALDWEIEIVHCYAPMAIDLGGPCAQRMRRALQAVHGYADADIITGGLPASTDLGYVIQATGNNDVAGTGVFSVQTMAEVHRPDEYVEVQALKDAAKMLVHYLVLD